MKLEINLKEPIDRLKKDAEKWMEKLKEACGKPIVIEIRSGDEEE